MTTRLDSIDGRISQIFCSRTHSRQRELVYLACMLAVDNSKIDSEDVRIALSSLRSNDYISEDFLRRIERARDSFDEKYFDALESDSGDMSTSNSLFSMARAVSAVCYALSRNHADWLESIYEAASSFEEQNAFLQTFHINLNAE